MQSQQAHKTTLRSNTMQAPFPQQRQQHHRRHHHHGGAHGRHQHGPPALAPPPLPPHAWGHHPPKHGVPPPPPPRSEEGGPTEGFLQVQNLSLRAAIVANRISLLRLRLKKAKKTKQHQPGKCGAPRLKQRLEALKLKYKQLVEELRTHGGPSPPRGAAPPPPFAGRGAQAQDWPSSVTQAVVDLRILRHCKSTLTLDEVLAFIQGKGCACVALATPQLTKSLGLAVENLPPQISLVSPGNFGTALLEVLAMSGAQHREPSQVVVVSCQGPFLKMAQARCPGVQVMRARAFAALVAQPDLAPAVASKRGFKEPDLPVVAAAAETDVVESLPDAVAQLSLQTVLQGLEESDDEEDSDEDITAMTYSPAK